MVGGARLFLTLWKLIGRVSGRAGCLHENTFLPKKYKGNIVTMLDNVRQHKIQSHGTEN